MIGRSGILALGVEDVMRLLKERAERLRNRLVALAAGVLIDQRRCQRNSGTNSTGQATVQRPPQRVRANA
jgi:hypothetical protein